MVWWRLRGTVVLSGCHWQAEAGPSVTLDFVLPDGANRFILNLARHLREAAAARPEVRLRLSMIGGFDPAAMAAKLGELADRSQDVGITALDHPVLREAIRSVIAGGTPVVTLASDITQVPRVGYIGIYSIGGGIEGIARAMEEAGRGGDVILIGHELTEHARRLLMSGTIDALIDQNPRVEAREAIDLLLQAARGAARPESRPMRVHAIFRGNLPD